MLKDAPNPDPRMSDVDIQRGLVNLRAKPTFPPSDNDNFNLPLPMRIDQFFLLHHHQFHLQLFNYLNNLLLLLLEKKSNWQVNQLKSRSRFQKKKLVMTFQNFSRAEDILNQKEEKVSQIAETTFLNKLEDLILNLLKSW